SGGNGKNHGQLWNDAHASLQSAPNNKIRETGWYVLMSNLHETGWHDYLGGPLSGWQRQYSAHIKNAQVYAEAARWAGGQYASATGAFFSDIDNDGNNELVIHNDRVFGVFESIGGRCTQLFAKGSGYEFSVVGIDNAYWAGTEGDYNDVNHVAALSDVGPNRQSDLYAMSVDVGSGNTVQASFTRDGLKKTVKLTQGQPFMDIVYRTGSQTQYIQSGFSPDVVDLLYNGRMTRVWGGGNRTYMGQRNPNTAATAAYVLGEGGATHQMSYSSTLMKVDEVYGAQKFELYLYAGATSAPDMNGRIAELDALSAGLTDQLAPQAVRGTYFPATRQLALTFDEPVQAGNVAVTSIRIDANDDGVPDVSLDAGCTVLTAGNASTITIQVSTGTHNSIQALTNRNAMELLLTSGAVRDVAGNLVATLTNTGNIAVSYGPPTLITLDGRFDASEWPGCTVTAADSNDSQWNAGPSNITNEIQAVHATWDSTYLYLGVRGIVTGNSWVLYLDTDPNGPNGQTNLTAINAWERGATFTAPGFKPDWNLGAYQHQGAFDSQSFFKLLSATTTANYSDSILKAFDPTHQFGLNGGSELAIPWSTLYGLGAGRVPASARIGLVASLCWDPEPAAELGGDQAPNNLSAIAPAIDNRVLVIIDGNGDGYPDVIDRTGPSLVSAVPTGYDSVIVLQFNEALLASTASQISRYLVYQSGNPTATLIVKNATLQAGGTQVRLIVSAMSYVPYTVVASGLTDVSCFQNTTSQSSAQFQGPPVAVEPGGTLTARLELAAPFPNPMRGHSTTVEYRLPGGPGGTQEVMLAVFDPTGRKVRTLVGGPQTAGMYRVVFDGTDDHRDRLAPGLYFVRVSNGASMQARRVVLLP
ncbi:MAG: FlgD immunoglobulin-like domain containing protein, partial [Candidatus Eisenbacteria bacterium]